MTATEPKAFMFCGDRANPDGVSALLDAWLASSSPARAAVVAAARRCKLDPLTFKLASSFQIKFSLLKKDNGAFPTWNLASIPLCRYTAALVAADDAKAAGRGPGSTGEGGAEGQSNNTDGGAEGAYGAMLG